MKLHGLEMTWQAVDDRLDTLCTAPTAREAMAQLYPAALEPKQLFLGRGLAARGEECCPLLVLRARIVLEEDAPRIVPVDDRYQLCSDTLHAVFGVDRDTLRNMSDMLEDAAAPETLRPLLEVWGRLLRGYCDVDAGKFVALAGRACGTKPSGAVPLEDAGVHCPAAWMRAAARRAAGGSRVLLTGRNMDRLHLLRGMLPADMPVLCSWDGAEQAQAFAERVLADMEQGDELTRMAQQACGCADQTHTRLQAARAAVDEARAVWDSGTPDPQHLRWNRLVPGDIPADQPFPLTDAQLALLCAAPEPDEPPADAFEQLAEEWQACCAQYAAAPVRLDGRPAALCIGALTLGAGEPVLSAEAVELLMKLSRMHDALEQENWLFDVLSCRNRAQLALYQTLEDALAGAADWYERYRALLEAHRVVYQGVAEQRGRALETLLELERKCAVLEADEPYSLREFGMRHAVRRAVRTHHTLVDGMPPASEEACRAARVGIEMQARMQAVEAAWSSLFGAFDRKPADCAPMAALLRLCLAWGGSGFVLRADELPLAEQTVETIRTACALAHRHAELCSALEQQGVEGEKGEKLDAVRRLDLEAYRAERARAAQAEAARLRTEKDAAIEAVRAVAPLWAAQLEQGVQPPDDVRAIWEWKRAQSRNAQDIGAMLSREAALSAQYNAEMLTACALRARTEAARRASADPLVYAALRRATRGDGTLSALTACAPLCFADTAEWTGFDVVMIDRAGFSTEQLAREAARAAQAFVLEVRETRTPETFFVAADGTMGYRRAAETLVQGSLSDRACRIWWNPDTDSTPEDQLGRRIQQCLEDGKTVAVVTNAGDAVRGRLRTHLPVPLLLLGTLYCGGPEILAARRFDTVIACPELSSEQLAAAARGSLGAGELWVLNADRIGADWGRQSVLSAWQSAAAQETPDDSADAVARVLREMCGWEAAGLAGGLEVRAGETPVWLALLHEGEAYPLAADERAQMYEAGWRLHALNLEEYRANPRAALEKLTLAACADTAV